MRGHIHLEPLLILAVASAVLLATIPGRASADPAPKFATPPATQPLLLAKSATPHGRLAAKQCYLLDTPVEAARCMTPRSTRAVVTKTLAPPRIAMPEWEGLRSAYAFASHLGSKHWW